MTRFCRTLLTGAAAGFLCLCAVLCAVAQDVFLRPAMEAFVDKDTLLVFPAQIDTFQKVRVRKNENPVFGTVVRYENELGSCADVYIYSLDTAAKPVQQDAYEKHCLETDQGILNLSAQNPKIKVEHIEAPGRKAPEGGYEMVAIGPTTSMRMEKLEYEFIRRTGIRFFIGKGSMGERTAEACREFGAVHCVLPAGNAVVTAMRAGEIKDVGWLDLGMAEAFWSIRVKELGPLIVSIDSNGNNLFDEKKKQYTERREAQLTEIGKRLGSVL